MWAVLHKRKLSSSQIILFGFAGVILIGTLLLMLPFATNSGQSASFWDDVCIVGIGNDFQSSLETTSLLKELGAKMVVSRAATDVQEKFLLRNGADEVVYPEKQLARWAAIRYSANHVLDYIELDGENAIFEVTIPQSWMGKTVGQLDIRKKFNINILGTKCGSKLDSFITPDTLLCEGKSLMVMGKYKDIQKCFRI